MDITESYDEYILRRSEGKSVVHWASLIGKTIADRYDEESFLVVNLDSSATESYLFKKDSRDSSIHVSKRLNGIAFLGDDADLDELLNDKQIQSWWKSVFFEADGFIEYDPYYDSFRVADGSDLTFGVLLERVTDSLSGLARLAKVKPDAVYIPKEYYRILPVRFILQSRICKIVRVLPELQDGLDECRYVRQQCKSKAVPVLSLNGGIPVSQLLGINPVVVHVPIDDELLSQPFIGTKTWKEVLPSAAFSYQISDLKFLIVKLDAKVDVFSNLFLSLSGGNWKKAVLVDACS